MSNIKYFDLSIPAPRRLAMMRADFANHGAEYPYCPEYAKPKTWRDVRAFTLKSWESSFGCLDQGFDGEGLSRVPVWYAHTGQAVPRERYADECKDAPRSIQEGKGYYCDVDAQETARGIVGALSHGRFVAGYRLSTNDERVYFPDLHHSERDAAIAAAGHAENIAGREQEFDGRYKAAQDLHSELDDMKIRLRECIALRHKKCMRYVRTEIASLCDSIRTMRETLESDFADVEL